MVESISERMSGADVISSHPGTKGDAGDTGKTGDIRGDKLNNGAALSPPPTDFAESPDPSEEKTAVENDRQAQRLEPARKEPPGSRVDILA